MAVTDLRKRLSLASATLLSSESQGQAFLQGVDTELALLWYQEPARVRAIEPAIALKKVYQDESVLSAKLVLDSLTGASHNGASTSDQVQTFTRPSGVGSYQTGANSIPLDDTFKDTRLNASLGYLQPLDRLNQIQWGFNGSNEYDFLSLGASAQWSMDSDNRNSTYSAAVAFEYDRIRPVGGFPSPLQEMPSPANFITRPDETDEKIITELLLGVTQVWNPQTLWQVNYGLSQSDGYHTDPYKVISVVDDSGQNVSGTAGLPFLYLYESRPDQRFKQNFYTRIKSYVRGRIVDSSYRFLWDDWGLRSHTLDFKFKSYLTASQYLEPHVRLYHQQAVDFYRHHISQNNLADVGNYLSADYRLGEMRAQTLGLKYGFKWSSGKAASIRLEYYLQRNRHHEDVDAFTLLYQVTL